ncbi:prepilin-type N-terminal cleavage/methylation domain-containing protein [Elusimicrobium simillimum]|uniref:type IV pilin protein n=1 Tax=Elusimicrobium simillimum TaxID=3143438 RepID=UPI003C6F6EC7
MKNFKLCCSIAKAEGFTLVEMLVVVLIIAILSGIAVPNYLKSVDKARAAEIFITVRALEEANYRYYLENKKRTDDINKLDIELPDSERNGCSTSGVKTSTYKVGNYCYYISTHSDAFFKNRVLGFDIKGETNVLMIRDGKKYCVDWQTAGGRDFCINTLGGKEVKKINTNYIYEVN